ncbi:MAG: hypothetical protein DRR06_07715 [Gammaproteobacteria bacterium]|nr:MAG: hypothetical protein DRR06_07715 [Gammaproteobacteria bacterium]RLA51924.1 MAG: hypothetical protein DRR42_08950 [Gammaproteobacteria bacterium]
MLKQSETGNSIYSHFYHVYGICFGSDVRIPGLEAEEISHQAMDIKIQMSNFPDEIIHGTPQPWPQYFIDPGDTADAPFNLVVYTLANGQYFYFRYGWGVEFIVDRRATHIWCQWRKSLSLEDASVYLLGPIIGFMLRLRGITCLHASSIVLGTDAIAFAGPSGAGKSTLAASFTAAGYPILSDDILAMTNKEDAVLAHPGYSRLRLLPNTFKNNPDLPDELPLLAPGWDKHYLDLAGNDYQFYSHTAQLKVIYIIDWSRPNTSAASIVDFSGVKSVAHLAANTYRNDLLDTHMKTQEFRFLGNLVNCVKIKKLYPTNNISTICETFELLLADAKNEITKPSSNLKIPESPKGTF